MFEQLRKDKQYLIGVSGGCDSMALLDMLHKAGYQVVAIHVNYFLRFDSSLDEMTVRSYCLSNEIPFRVRHVHQEDYQKGNFQTIARKIRYRFYAKIGAEFGCDTVVLGHHLDDQYETIYMQKMRGFTGFMGISGHSEVEGLSVIRPLLETPKSSLRSYCHDNGVYYRDDYTNFEVEFTRDRIRNIVMPDLSASQKKELLLYRGYHNLQKSNLIKQVKPAVEKYRKQGSLDIGSFSDDNYQELLYAILALYLDKELINYNLIDEIYKQLESPKPNLKISLPVNYEFIKEYHNVYVTSVIDMDQYEEIVTAIEPLQSSYFKLELAGPLNNGVFVKADDLPLTIRSPKAGDKIVTSGGTKKVSRIFIDNKIPLKQRKIYPVVLNARNELILVPGLAKNIGYMTTKANIFVLLL